MKWALLANVLFALVDIVWKQAQQHNSVSVNTAIRSLTSVGILGGLLLAFTPDFPALLNQVSTLLMSDFRMWGIGILGWLGLWAFGKALKDGALHTIIPVVALTPVITYLFWFIQTHTGFMPLENLGILALMITGILLSFQFQSGREKAAGIGPVLWACLASLSWGLSYSWYEPVTTQLGALPTAAWVEACIAFASLLVVMNRRTALPQKLQWPMLSGLLTCLAVMSTVQSYAQHGTESTAIAGVVTPVLSIAGAWLINKEKPLGPQWISVSILLLTLIWQALRLQ